MTAKKEIKKRQTKSEQAARDKMTPMKKAAKKKLVIKGEAPTKPSANKAAHKKATAKVVGKKSKSTLRKPIRRRSQTAERAAFSPKGPAARSGGQSGDLQGLSRAEQADSESVDELIEEGNPFEADVVTGVENADNADEKEVHTHEVPEDDIPDEYFDKE